MRLEVDVLVVIEGGHARSQAAAHAIVDAATSYGVDARFLTIDKAEGSDVAAASALVVGCVAKTDTPFGGACAQSLTSWIEALPTLDGKPVGVFCTYRFFPHTFADVTTRTSEVLSGLEAAVLAKGGRVMASEAILNRRLGEGVSVLLAPFLAASDS